MFKTTRSTNIVFAIVFMLTVATTANAYVDPGSGSFLVQMLIAGVVGAAFTVKGLWGNLKNAVVSRVRRQERSGVQDG